MSDEILNGDVTVHYNAENGRKQMVWTGSSTGKRALNALYSAVQNLFDEPAQMDDLVPMKADTPDIYRLQNQWFMDDQSIEHFTGGSLFSDKWKDGTTEHVLIIGYDPATVEFDEADIGRNIVGVTSGDEGTLLDFNTIRNLVWIRPDDPLTAGDEFDNGAEVFRIGSAVNGDPVGDATQEDNNGGPSFVNQTADANEATPADVQCFPATSEANDSFYLGFEQTFSKVVVDRLGGTQGVGGVTAYEYSQGGGQWGTLAGVSDATATGGGLGNAAVADGDEITFTVPSDWAPDSVDGGAQLFYIRFRVTTIYTTEPIFDQCFVSGVADGTFATHNRHGVGAKGGESAWAGMTSIASVEADSHLYIAQEDPDLITDDAKEVLVTSTKGTSDWWGDGDIDILLKVKEGDNVIGQLPNSSPATAVATVFARQYTKQASHFIATGLNTAGGNTVIPLSAGDDLDNPLGYRNQIWDNGTSESLVDEELLYVVGNLDAGNLDAGVSFEDPATFVDDTTDLNDTGGTDVPIFPTPESINDAFYFGKDNIFQFLLADIATQGVSSAAATAWEYWNGSTWGALTTVDDSDSGNGAFTEVAGRHLISWTPPSDWARTTVTNQPAAAPVNLYYIRVRVTAENYSTAPVLDVAFVAGEAQLKARMADATITTPGGATGNGDYYLLGDPIVDLVDDDVVIAGTSRKTFDVNGGPTNVGPAADTDITATHGAILVDIDESGVNEPYSIDINNASNKVVAEIYERFKFLIRRGETAVASTDGQQGQFYIGSELQIEYTGQAGGNFSEGRRVYDQTSEAEGIIVADHDDGANGDLIIRTLRGTFVAGNVLSDSPDPSYVMNTLSFCFNVDATPIAIVDQSADALSAATNDVQIVPASHASGDYFVIGATKPFARVVFDNTTGTAGTVGTVAWEYWNGTAWVDLEAAPGFVDGTTEFKNALGVVNLDFTPPVDWRPKGESDGTFNSQTLFMIRARVTGLYTIDPVYDTVAVEDLVTATIGSVRSIAPVVSAPFGTFPGASKVFFAPGAAPQPAEMAPADVQAYQTIDDDGNTILPPNKQAMVVTNLNTDAPPTDDSVAVFRRTGLVITKTQFTLLAGNNQGDSTVVVDATIPVDNPNTANSKIRIISVSGDEHRYRYTSFTAATFTLAAASTGTADGGSTQTSLFDAAADFVTDGVEVGDYVRNTTDGVFVRVLAIVDLNTLTTEDAGITWDAKAYTLNTLVENYGLQSSYVPLIERIADAILESNTITFLAPLDVRIEVRNAGEILPFSQDAQFISSGLSIAAIRNADDIFT